MKIKVLFFVSTLERGGPTNIIYNIIKYLDRNIIEPCVLTLSPEPEQSKKKEFEDLGVHIYSFHKGRLWWIFSRMHALKTLIEEISPDVIHSHSLRPDVSSAKHLSQFTRMATLHGILYTNYTHTYGRMLGSYLAKRQLKSVQQLEYAVACSQSIYNFYKDQIKNFSFIQNGVDEDFFHPLSASEKIEQRKKLNLPAEKKIILTVGSLTLLKDPVTIIESFKKSRHNKDSILVIIGTGVLGKKLKDKYGKETNIIFIGYTSYVAMYLQCADLYISASTSEGLPNAVMEALGCGVPVCLSDIPSHREILSIHPGAGEIFQCHDQGQLIDAIGKMLDGKNEEASILASRIIKEKLNASVMALSYQKLYVSLHQKRIPAKNV